MLCVCVSEYPHKTANDKSATTTFHFCEINFLYLQRLPLLQPAPAIARSIGCCDLCILENDENISTPLTHRLERGLSLLRLRLHLHQRNHFHCACMILSLINFEWNTSSWGCCWRRYRYTIWCTGRCTCNGMAWGEARDIADYIFSRRCCILLIFLYDSFLLCFFYNNKLVHLLILRIKTDLLLYYAAEVMKKVFCSGSNRAQHNGSVASSNSQPKRPTKLIWYWRSGNSQMN